MASNRDINYEDWTKNIPLREEVAKAYKNLSDGYYYSVVKTRLPSPTPDPDNASNTIYKPMSLEELNGEDNNNRDRLAFQAIRKIYKKLIKDLRYDAFRAGGFIEGGVRGDQDFGSGIQEFGPNIDFSYEWSREQSPNGKYLFCIRMSQNFVDKYIWQGNPSEPSDAGLTPALVPLGGPASRNQNELSKKLSPITKSFLLQDIEKDIDNATTVLQEYKTLLEKENITPEDINGFDISKEIRLYRKSAKKIKSLMKENEISFNEEKFTERHTVEFLFDKDFFPLAFTYDDPDNLRQSQEFYYYNGFNRRDLSNDELEGIDPVFVPKGVQVTEEIERKINDGNILERTQNIMVGWTPTTYSLLANTDKILEQKGNIGTSDLKPWTEFLAECVHPNPCFRVGEIKNKTPKREDQLPALVEIPKEEDKVQRAAKRSKEFNIIEDPIINCSADLDDMFDGLEGLYDLVLNRFSMKQLISAAAEKTKNEMRNQAAIFANELEQGVEEQINKVVDLALSELDCAVDIVQGKLEDKFLSPIKELPVVGDLLADFDPPDLTFEAPSFQIESWISAVRTQIIDLAIDLIESLIMKKITDLVKDFLGCDDETIIDGITDRGGGLFEPFSKAAFGQAKMSDFIPVESISDLAESAGIPQDKIEILHDSLSDVTTPREILSLLRGEATNEILGRISTIIDDVLQDLLIEPHEVVTYLGRVGDTVDQDVKNQIAAEKTEAVFCNDLDYEDAAAVIRDILGDRANQEAKSAFDRNKQKIRSLCGIQEEVQQDLTSKIENLRMPSAASQVLQMTCGAVNQAHIAILDTYLANYANRTREGDIRVNDGLANGYQSFFNRAIQIYSSDYPVIRYGRFPDQDGQPYYYRFGNWILGVSSVADGDVENIQFVISNRQTPHRNEASIARHSFVRPEGSRLATEGRASEVYPLQVNKAFNGQFERDPGDETSLLFYYDILLNNDSTKEDLNFTYTNLGPKTRFREKLLSKANNCYKILNEYNPELTVKDSLNGVLLKSQDTACLSALLSRLFPFFISTIFTLQRDTDSNGNTITGANRLAPRFYQNDTVTNKLITDYLYNSLFRSYTDNWLTETTNIKLPIGMRRAILERSEQIYAAFSSQNSYGTDGFISPGIEEVLVSERDGGENTPQPPEQDWYERIGDNVPTQDYVDEQPEQKMYTKKLISLLLNYFLSESSQEISSNAEKLNASLMRRIPSAGGDHNVTFPLQPLVALFVIRGFHDNNGWLLATENPYEEDSDFKKYRDAALQIYQKSREDDETRLSTL
tara:strand:- start:26850 stop:30695 length:3846 start_codon:yes stop_codon:yes gene_type:complete